MRVMYNQMWFAEKNHKKQGLKLREPLCLINKAKLGKTETFEYILFL